MPCDSVTRMQVNLKVADRTILKAALLAVGWQVVERGQVLIATSPIGTTVEISADQVVLVASGRTRSQVVDRGYQDEIVAQIQQAYTSEVIRQTVANFGKDLDVVVAQEFGSHENPVFEIVMESL